MTAVPGILVFDSGLGGLTVYREVVGALPDARYLYVADDAFFPYGSQEEGALIARVVELMGELIATHRPDLVIIACNTASTLVLPQLRARFLASSACDAERSRCAGMSSRASTFRCLSRVAA